MEGRRISLRTPKIKQCHLLFATPESEQKNEVSVADSSIIFKNAKGWDSDVEVTIVTDGVQLKHYNIRSSVSARNSP